KDGARLGAFAGLVGGLIYFVIGGPFMISQMKSTVEMMASDSRVPSQYQTVYSQLAENNAALLGIAIFITILTALFLVGFCILGGLLGISIFEKRKPGAETPWAGQGYPAPAFPAPPQYSAGQPVDYTASAPAQFPPRPMTPPPVYPDAPPVIPPAAPEPPAQQGQTGTPDNENKSW
ncbi:MAG: hypothetical protein ACKV2V_26115, partial [Blastocatellia bacterium]